MYRFERYVVVVEADGTYFKMMQFMFSKKDGSLFVSFPYFEHSEGIAAEVPDPESDAPTDRHLPTWGKVTSHLIKYSHHPDGRAHFSQDGKVRTEILKQSIPIDRISGHTFTVQIQGLDAFEHTKDDLSKTVSKNRQYLVFRAKGKTPAALRIVGRWYTVARLIRQNKHFSVEEIPHATTAADKKTVLYICSTLEGAPGDDRALLINLVPMDAYNKQGGPSMIFYGGGDPQMLARHAKRPSTHLVVSYPAGDFEELEKTIGSIDFHRED